jgi:hypothetical protein
MLKNNAKIHDPALGQMPMRYAVQREEQTNKPSFTSKTFPRPSLFAHLPTFAFTSQPYYSLGGYG